MQTRVFKILSKSQYDTSAASIW